MRPGSGRRAAGSWALPAFVIAVACCRSPVAAAHAQLPQRIDERPAPWLMRLLPYPTWDNVEGFAAHLNFGFIKRSNLAPPPVSLGVGLEATVSAAGTLGLNVRYDAPGWWTDWRLLVWAGAERLRRVPYFGLGNNSVLSDTLSAQFYRYQLTRLGTGAVIQRRITGPVRLHLAAQWRHYRAAALSDTTAFAADVTAGLVSDTSASHSAELRAGLLYDTRDEESSPTRGLFVELMAARGVADFSYTRWLVSARQFFPLGEFEQWVIALRQTAELSRGDIPVFIQYERPTTWYPEDGFGGPTSLRLYAPGRFVAPNRGIASIDVRKKLIDFPLRTSPMRVWALVFADVGRLWDEGERPTLNGMHWATGLGGRVQMGKGTIFGLDVGLNGEDGFTFGVGTSFAF